MGYSKNKEAAREFLRYVMQYDNYVEWLKAGQGYSTAPTKIFAKDKLWGELDPQVEPFKDIVKYGRHYGYAGPASRKAAEALSKYIIVDMFAKTIQGTSPQESIAWATSELRQIYET
jgi:multiple sugar transport system substrate-binding protein